MNDVLSYLIEFVFCSPQEIKEIPRVALIIFLTEKTKNAIVSE